MMLVWVPLLIMAVTMVGAGALIAVSHRTGIPEQLVFSTAVIGTGAPVWVLVMRWAVPPHLGGGTGHPVRDWAMLLTPWILTAVAVAATVVRKRLRPAPPVPVAQADCSRCQAELYEDSTGRGRFYSDNPVSYLCPEEVWLPGNRRHESVPRAAAVSARD